MDPTAPRSVAATTVVSATDSLGSVAVLRATPGTGRWRRQGQERRGVGQQEWAWPSSPTWASRCREECPVGHFGQDCAEKCDCTPGARCFPANGACLCEHGFTGDRCTERLCPDGLYGLSCQEPCTCDPEHSLRWAAGHWSRAQEAVGVTKKRQGHVQGREGCHRREKGRKEASGIGKGALSEQRRASLRPPQTGAEVGLRPQLRACHPPAPPAAIR